MDTVKIRNFSIVFLETDNYSTGQQILLLKQPKPNSKSKHRTT